MYSAAEGINLPAEQYNANCLDSRSRCPNASKETAEVLR
jgi:hypothetical protein